MALLTTAYDPNSAKWVQDAIQLSEELQQRQAAQQERQREFEKTQEVAKLQSARIAAAAAQKLAFDQANMQADNARADRRLAIDEEAGKPWVPPGQSTSPSQSVPSIPATPSAPGQFQAGGSPARGGFSMGGRTPSYSESVSAASGPFTLEATGYHPGDVRSAKEARMEGGNVDAQGNPIHTLEEFKSGRAPHVTVAVPQGSPLFGKTLASPDAPGVTFRATDHFGTLGGKLVDGPKIDIATSSRGTASGVTGPMRFEVSDTPASRLVATAEELRKAGVPVTNKAMKEGAASALASAGRIAAKAAASDKPIVRNFPDGTARQWNAKDQDWDVVASKPENNKPIVRDFADGTTRQWNATEQVWQTQASKPERSDSNLFDSPKELLEKYPNATPVFDQKSGKLRPKFPDATAIAQEDPKFSDIKTKFEDVSGLRVNPDDPNEVWKPSYDARGRPSFSRVNDVHRMQDGDLLIVHPSGETERISAPTPKISGTDIKRLQDIESKITETEGSLSSAYVKAHPEAAASVTQELSTLKKQREQWLSLKPGLAGKASIPATPSPAAIDEKVSVVAPNGQKGRVPRSQLDAAIKAGYKEI